jgi:hypothetical protein
MPHNIHALIYVSHSHSVMHDVGANAIIQDILAKSRTKNLRLGVTGALLFSEGYFSQVLEGEESAVERIFEAIEADTRHHDITVLSRATTRRHFPEWSMAYAGISPAPVWMSKPELLTNPSAIDGDRSGQQLIERMTELVRDPKMAPADLANMKLS